MKAGIHMFIFLVLGCLAGCGNDLFDNTDFGSMPPGAYRYLGFDSKDQLVVKGWLRFDSLNPESFEGDWHLEPVGDPQNIGPQAGDGRLVGRIVDGITQVDLNPEFRDNNVTLSGALQNDSYRGRWTWSGFAGPISQGRFEAKRD